MDGLGRRIGEDVLVGEFGVLLDLAHLPEPDRDDAEPPLRWDEVVLVRAELQTRTSDLRAMFDLVATTLERLEALAPSWAES